MSTPEQPKATGRFRRLKWTVGIVGGVLLAYLLSAGPALYCAQRRLVATETVEKFYFSPYTPFELTRNIVPGAELPLTMYINWWQSLTPELNH